MEARINTYSPNVLPFWCEWKRVWVIEQGHATKSRPDGRPKRLLKDEIHYAQGL